MNILYISCLCSKIKYEELFNNSKEKPGQQVQKYHRLMTEGLSKCKNIKVTVLSGLPISRSATKKIYYKKQLENINEISYKYLPFINFPVIRHLFLFVSCFISTLNYSKKNKDFVIICDILNISVSLGALLVSKLLKIKSIGIVTDIPEFLMSNSKEKLTIFNNILNKTITIINKLILNSFNSYVFLTQQMDTLVNKNHKPYIVIEGQVDINMKDVPNNIENKYEKKVCIYAGALKKNYGLKMLTEAFLKANIIESELHIYGNGPFETELKQICNIHKNIKFFGVIQNDIVVKKQIKATLLINPRPTHEEYTNYSFPSKNMEYMVSGTPILTTKLPGMPSEYNDYVYLIEEESVNGIEKELKKILSLSKDELHTKGKDAKNFVLQKKNNIIQAEKLMYLIL